jgi:hypothetical protein
MVRFVVIFRVFFRSDTSTGLERFYETVLDFLNDPEKEVVANLVGLLISLPRPPTLVT